MTPRPQEQGFTTAELLITIFVGVAFILTAYQLYGIIAGNSSNTQQQAIASNLAYADLQVAAGQVGVTCATSSSSPSIPSGTALPRGSSATVAITCPFGTSSAVSEVTATVTYGSNKVSHGIYATQ